MVWKNQQLQTSKLDRRVLRGFAADPDNEGFLDHAEVFGDIYMTDVLNAQGIDAPRSNPDNLSIIGWQGNLGTTADRVVAVFQLATFDLGVEQIHFRGHQGKEVSYPDEE